MHRQFLCCIHCVNFQAVSCRPQSAVCRIKFFCASSVLVFSSFCRHQSPSLHRQASFRFFFIVRILLFASARSLLALSITSTVKLLLLFSPTFQNRRLYPLWHYHNRPCMPGIYPKYRFYIKLRVAFKGKIFGANVEIIRDFPLPTVVVPR